MLASRSARVGWALTRTISCFIRRIQPVDRNTSVIVSHVPHFFDRFTGCYYQSIALYHEKENPTQEWTIWYYFKTPGHEKQLALQLDNFLTNNQAIQSN